MHPRYFRKQPNFADPASKRRVRRAWPADLRAVVFWGFSGERVSLRVPLRIPQGLGFRRFRIWGVDKNMLVLLMSMVAEIQLKLGTIPKHQHRRCWCRLWKTEALTSNTNGVGFILPPLCNSWTVLYYIYIYRALTMNP